MFLAGLEVYTHLVSTHKAIPLLESLVGELPGDATDTGRQEHATLAELGRNNVIGTTFNRAD